MDIADISIFLSIVTSGSISKTANLQNTSTVQISRRLAALEKDLGIRLFHRTTRSMSLTPDGEAFLPYAMTMVEASEAAVSTLNPNAGASGVLKVTSPAIFGQTVITPFLGALLAENPNLKLDLKFTDSMVDIIGDGMDLAIRVGKLKDSALVARKLTDNPRIIVASPAYIEKHGRPRTLKELLQHECLILAGIENWPFLVDGVETLVKVSGKLTATDVQTVRTTCMSGLGIASIAYWDVRQQLAEGTLLEINLADAQLDELAIWAVFPTRTFVPIRVRVFLEKLEQALK
jgi:DNA-binding transcriptional LysR family regulator